MLTADIVDRRRPVAARGPILKMSDVSSHQSQCLWGCTDASADTMDSDPDYKSLLSKLEREYRITINEFLGESSLK